MKQKLLLTITLWLALLGSTWAQSNNALHFSYATKNRVDIGAFAAGSPNFSQGFTFAGWVKFDQFKDLARVFTFAPSQTDGSNNLMLCASGTTGLLMAEVSVEKVYTTTALQTNKWHFLTLTVTSGGLTTIYVDGVSAASKTLTAPANIARNTCYLGNSSYDEARGLNGSLDEVSIWSRALSAAEIAGIMNGISSPTTQTGLLAYYTFNQGTAGGSNTSVTTLADATTNAKHGTLKDYTLSGTTSNWVAGYTSPTTNNALHFDGSNDYVSCPTINPTQFTVEAWVYPTQLNRDQPAFSTLSETANTGMELHIGNDNKPLITIRNGGGWLDVKATSAVGLNTWVHLAATYNGSTVKLYVNGAEVQTASATSFTPGSKALYIGKRSEGNASVFSGRIDEVRIWSAARTETDIAATKDNPLTGTETNLLVYYNFNQGTAGGSNTSITTLTDASANAKHGTLNGFNLSGSTSNWVEGFNFSTFVPLTVTITKTDQTQTTATNATSLQAAIGSVPLGEVQKLEITAGTFTPDDWLWLKDNRASLNSLTHFTITDGAAAVADIPNTTQNNAYFSLQLQYFNVTKVEVIGKYAFTHNVTESLSTVNLPNARTIEVAAFDANITLESVAIPRIESIKSNAFSGCLRLSHIMTGKTPPAVDLYFSTFSDCPTPRYLTLADANGNPLTGTALDNARAAYRAVDDGNTTDDLWYGWSITSTLYNVNVSADIENGSLGILPILAHGHPEGSSVTITASPAAGYLLLPGSLRAYKTGDESVTVAVIDGKFTMPGFDVTVSGEFVPDKLHVNITQTDNTVITSTSFYTLQEAIGSTPLGDVKKLEITNGNFNTADWQWLQANRTSLSNLTHFTITNGIASVADIPYVTGINPYFGHQLEEIHVAKLQYIGKSAFDYDQTGYSGIPGLTSASFPSLVEISNYAFFDCASLTNMLLGTTPPLLGNEAFVGVPIPRDLAFADPNGNLLTGTALENARAAYKAVNDGNTTDNLWYGWTIDRNLYKVGVATPTNGTLTAGNPDEMVFGGYPAGATINVTATPSYGYRLANGSPRAYKTDDQSVEVTISNGSFTMPEYGVTVTATFEPKLSASATTVTLGKEAGQSGIITVNADNDWTLTGTTPEWLSVSRTSGYAGEVEVTFTTTEANPWAFEREVVFTLTAAEANDITITVKQEASPEVFIVSKTQASLGYQQGSTDIISITNNIPWSASTAPYSHLFSVSPTEGAGNAELTITALTENTGLADIYGEISVNGETYPITQRFNAKELSISQTDILVGKEAGSTVQVEVTSGTDWWFDNTNEHFYFEPASGTGNATVTITANGAVSGYRNNVSTPLLTGAEAYPVQLTIAQKSDYMPLGDGTAENPFQISTLDNLRWMSENLDDNSPYLRCHYVLTNDIDAQETHNWPDGFRAIRMNYTNYFAGTFNGKGYAISNLFLRHFGLFYRTAPEARIDSLALVNTLVKGYKAAGLVKNNEGTINACYVTGYTEESYNGMLAFSNAGTITSCYTSGFIAGENSAGLCQENTGTISGSYTAVVSLYEMGNDGFVWRNHGTAHGYFNKELFADTNSPAIGLTTADMQQQANFEGWDFTHVWSMAGGKSFPRLQGVYNYPLLLPTYKTTAQIGVLYQATLATIEMDAPITSIEVTQVPEGMTLDENNILRWTPTTGGMHAVTLTLTDANNRSVKHSFEISVSLAGEGTEANPYQISTIAELDMIRQMQPGAHFLLMNDLDFAGTKYAYNPQYPEATGWQPIGDPDENYFFSHFNGNGHVIKNLYINQPDGGNLGLFAPCYQATIKNLGLVDVNITGYNYCGGITGLLENSTITSCYVTGSVKGKNKVGGLVGESKYSQVAKCYANATVEGDESVGGLIGYNNNVATLSNSYAAGTVSGRKNVGGLLGAGVNNFTSCYSVSVATDSAAYWGLNGDAYVNGLTKSYYLLEGNADVTNFEGTRLTAQQLMQQASFTDWDFTDTWQITEGQTLPRLRGLYNHPVVLPVADTAQINKPYTHTLRVVGMDNTVASVSISGVEGMTLSETDNTLTWTPANANEPTLTVTATDANGAVTHHRQRIVVIPFNGEGTEDSPYKITTIAQLNAVRNYSDKVFELMNDLNFDGSEYSKANSQNGWLPIEKFTGKFDGNGYLIKNLYINTPENGVTGDGVGLFATITKDEEIPMVYNLGLVNVDIRNNSDKFNMGALCGTLVGENAQIHHCYVTGTVKGNNQRTGGIVGTIENGATVTDCYSTTIVTAATGSTLGGIAGVNSNGRIQCCYNAGSTYFEGSVSGIVGNICGVNDGSDASISACYYTQYAYSGCGQNNNGATDYSTIITEESIKKQARYVGFEFNSTNWAIVEGFGMPALTVMRNNAPFVFREGYLYVGASLNLRKLIANDYDHETGQDKLVVKLAEWDSNSGTTDARTHFTLSKEIAVDTEVHVHYVVGEVVAPGDTLWGGRTRASIKKITNNAPGGGAGSVTIAEDTALEEYDAIALFSDPDGDYLTIVRMVDGFPLHGTATIANNRITYQPNADYYGNDELRYIITDGEYEVEGIVTITITSVNDAPVLTAVTDKSINKGENITLTMDDVTATDAEGDALSLVIANGDSYTVSGNTITPGSGFTGTLSVTISVTDGELTSNQMVMTVTVTPATGIDDNTAATVSAYPNPFTDYLVIESEEQIHSVSFINILGKTVQHTSMPQAQVSTHNLLPGIYLVKVDFAKGKPVVIRMVKQ